MGLKITTQIGTDKGITSEAYVRISTYNVSKYGYADFQLELFQSQSEAENAQKIGSKLVLHSIFSKNYEIGDCLNVKLEKPVEKTRKVLKSVPYEIPAVLDADGKEVTPAMTQSKMEEVDETYTTNVPDLSSAENSNIFKFGYDKLKEKLISLYGEENVVNC